jgi:hypothetical protein
MADKNSVTHYEEAALTALRRAETCQAEDRDFWVGSAQVNATLAVMAQLDWLANR